MARVRSSGPPADPLGRSVAGSALALRLALAVAVTVATVTVGPRVGRTRRRSGPGLPEPGASGSKRPALAPPGVHRNKQRPTTTALRACAARLPHSVPCSVHSVTVAGWPVSRCHRDGAHNEGGAAMPNWARKPRAAAAQAGPALRRRWPLSGSAAAAVRL
jgi:hypothetical protein